LIPRPRLLHGHSFLSFYAPQDEKRTARKAGSHKDVSLDLLRRKQINNADRISAGVRFSVR
jgi:hypothetical protein